MDQRPTLIGYWDREACNVTANDALAEHVGRTAADIRGRHIGEVLGPEDYATLGPHLDAVLDGAEPFLAPESVETHGVAWHAQHSLVPNLVDGRVQGFYHQVKDVTARIEQEHARDEVIRLYQISMTNAPIGKTILDTSGFVLQVNPAMCKLLGCDAEDLVGNDFRRFVDPGNLESGEADLASLVAGTAAQVASERRYVRRDGTVVWMQRNAVLVPGAHGAADVVIAQFQDVSGRRRAEAELARLAVTDPLTGLPNRYALVDYVDTRRLELPDAPLGVIFIDLDGFKRINDVHGHAAGDAVLVHAAERVAALVGDKATAYRLGGDEFVVLAPDHPTSTHTAELAHRIRLTMSGIHNAGAAAVTLAASVGWTWGPTQHAEDLLRTADVEMYRQKGKRGRRRTDWIIGSRSGSRRSSFG